MLICFFRVVCSICLVGYEITYDAVIIAGSAESYHSSQFGFSKDSPGFWWICLGRGGEGVG